MRLITQQHLAVLSAVSTDVTGYVLNGVLFEETKKGLRAVATDGRIMAVVEKESDESKDFPTIPALQSATNTAKGGIVPTEALKKAKKGLSKKNRVPVLNTIALKLNKNESTLATTNLTDSSIVPTRMIEGQYPRWEQVIPKEKPVFEISVSSGYLRELADIVDQFTETKNSSVHLQFTSPLKPIKVEAFKDDAHLTVVVMPRKD